MANKVRITIDSAGVRSLLKSEEVQQTCQKQASDIMARTGGGSKSETHLSSQRAIVNVWASSAKARQDNAKSNTLLKSLRKGG